MCTWRPAAVRHPKAASEDPRTKNAAGSTFKVSF